jgi:hypothetical protein
MELDEYNKRFETYTISNLYYDTSDDFLIRESLSKPNYKEKLRIRAYGVPAPDADVFVEIKKKVNGLVNKRRSGMKLFEAYSFLKSGIAPERRGDLNPQVISEISYFRKIYPLRPAVYLAYDRRAYFDESAHDVRLTIDKNIRTRRRDLALETGDAGELLVHKYMRLMEIKVERSIPVWLSKLLAEFKIYPTSFSKYGAEYIKTTIQRKTREEELKKTRRELLRRALRAGSDVRRNADCLRAYSEVRRPAK